MKTPMEIAATILERNRSNPGMAGEPDLQTRIANAITEARREAVAEFKEQMKPLILKHATQVAGLIMENKELKAKL